MFFSPQQNTFSADFLHASRHLGAWHQGSVGLSGWEGQCDCLGSPDGCALARPRGRRTEDFSSVKPRWKTSALYEIMVIVVIVKGNHPEMCVSVW